MSEFCSSGEETILTHSNNQDKSMITHTSHDISAVRFVSFHSDPASMITMSRSGAQFPEVINTQPLNDKEEKGAGGCEMSCSSVPKAWPSFLEDIAALTCGDRVALVTRTMMRDIPFVLQPEALLNEEYLMIHIVAQYSQSVDILDHVLAMDHNVVAIQDRQGKTPLHVLLGRQHFPTQGAMLKQMLSRYKPSASQQSIRSLMPWYVQDSEEGRLILHYAAANLKHGEDFEAIISLNEAAVYSRDKAGMTPFHILAGRAQFPDQVAVLKRMFPVCEDLLPIMTDEDGDTPLHAACRVVVVAASKSNKSDTDSDRDGDGDSDTDTAGSEVVCYLLDVCPEAVALKNHSSQLPLHCACASGNVAAVTKLLEVFEDGVKASDDRGLLPLHYAAQCGNFEVFDLVLRSSISKQQTGTSSFTIDYGSILHCVANRLTDHTADTAKMLTTICSYDKTAIKSRSVGGLMPLHRACRQGSPATVRCLWDACSEVSSEATADGRLPLHFWMLRGVAGQKFSEEDEEIVRLLLSKYPKAAGMSTDLRSSPNRRHTLGRNNRTPYGICVSLGYPDTTRRILLRADPSADFPEFCRLNYEARRMLLFIAFSAIVPGGDSGSAPPAAASAAAVTNSNTHAQEERFVHCLQTLRMNFDVFKHIATFL